MEVYSVEFLAGFYKLLLHICSMFQRLQKKWKVSGMNLLLILATFTIGGSLCGILGKKIMGLTSIEKGPSWILIYVIILTAIWPLCVLVVSIFFGQFTFFKNYISKIYKRMTGQKNIKEPPTFIGPSYRLAIFASGAGSNAQRIIEHFKNNPGIEVSLVLCNRPGAGVLEIASHHSIPTLLIEKERFYNGDGYAAFLQQHKISHIILAGFLLKVPTPILQQWPQAIINIHPALLPKYGGKGMYGARVHEAVIANGEKESGISIHYVDEIYDNGDIILQARCMVDKSDTADTLAAKIHALEHEHYPAAIEQFLKAKGALNKMTLSPS